MDDLKKQAEELGIKVDKRWSDQRLQAEIDEKLAADPEPEVVAQPDVGPVVVEPAPVVEPESAAEPEPEPELSAEEKAAADAEIQAEIQARFDASQEDGSVVIVNLKENPMKVLGLSGLHSEATLTAAQLADPRFYAKVERAKTLGLIKVKQ